MFLPEHVKPGEWWRPGHTRQRQVDWIPVQGVSPTAIKTATPGFRVWRVCHPPHTKKRPPLSGGENVCGTGPNTPAKPPKPPLWSTGLIITDASMAFTYTDSDSRHRAFSAIASENRL